MPTNADSASEESLARTIDAFYEAAVAPGRLIDALGQMRDLFAVGSAAFVVYNADRSHVEGLAAGVDPDGHREQLRTLFRNTPPHLRSAPSFSGQIVRDEEIAPMKEFQRSRMYQEYWRPRGFAKGLRLNVSIDGAGVHHVINLLSDRSGGPYDQGHLNLARIVMPHLQRTVALRRRLNEVDMLASAALAVLDTLHHPVLLLDQDVQLLHANARADAMLRKADGLGARQNILFAATPASTRRLHEVLAVAANPGGKAGALSLPRPDGRRALALLAMPFRVETNWSLSRRTAVLVCVNDPESVAAPRSRHLAQLFGLTGAEAALAAELLAGLDLRAIADRRGRSVNTVRSQLARLMVKTNVNRQSELIRLLGHLPSLGDAM